MNNILSIENLESKCTGCSACLDACPVHCITHNYTGGGTQLFAYPQVEQEKCTACGKCLRICPIVNEAKTKEQQHLYVAYSLNREKRNAGSSGGIFGLLAEHWLASGGYVCGAAFEGTKLKHRIIHGNDDMAPLLKSKYLQSDMAGIYSQIVALLKRGEKVFFSGTPCQVSALKNFVPQKFHDNLMTADLICHGVPSQKIFDSYIRELEKKHKGKITDFKFRDKSNKYGLPHAYSYCVERNGKTSVYRGVSATSSFYNAFRKYLILRESCYNCQYATLQRVSDITLADFWGIEKYKPDLNANNGISMVITNTPKGEELYEAISGTIYSEECPVEYGIKSNHCLTHAPIAPKNHDEIMRSLETNGYSETAKKYFSCGLIRRLYFQMPVFIHKVVKKLR